MLASLDSKVHELACVDEVDESGGTRRWNKKAADHLEKLNSDSNMTAGLEAKLRLAVGAHRHQRWFGEWCYRHYTCNS